jgi:excisionase family DNA binding protein
VTATSDGDRYMTNGSALLTVAEVAASMRVSTMTVYRLIRSGDLRAMRVGRSYRVRRSEVEDYLLSSSVQVEDV